MNAGKGTKAQWHGNLPDSESTLYSGRSSRCTESLTVSIEAIFNTLGARRVHLIIVIRESCYDTEGLQQEWRNQTSLWDRDRRISWAQSPSGHLAVTLFRNKTTRKVWLLNRAVLQRTNAGLPAERASSLTPSCSLCMPLKRYDF